MLGLLGTANRRFTWEYIGDTKMQGKRFTQKICMEGKNLLL